jgi:hypothetical protein
MALSTQGRVPHRAKFGAPPSFASQRPVPSFLLAPTPAAAAEPPAAAEPLPAAAELPVATAELLAATAELSVTTAELPSPVAEASAQAAAPSADAAEPAGTHPEIDAAAPEALPALWRQLADRLAGVLGSMPSHEAPEALDDVARTLAALVARAPDLAVFLLVRPDYDARVRVGVVRSLQAATAALLVGRHAGWPVERRLTFAKAALTMNLGMLELQERLSNQARLPDPTQRRAIHAHPLTSVQMLKDSGIADEEWLQAVGQHHEQPNGGGYPTATTRVSEMANALRVIDVYTAKLAGRSGRDALPPERALRDLMVVERGNPFAVALGAEFGRHPPGSLVRLHSGEIGAVVRRGAEAPRVAVLLGRRGEPLAEPVMREAGGREHGIAGDVEPRSLRAQIIPERLFAKTGA